MIEQQLSALILALKDNTLAIRESIQVNIDLTADQLNASADAVVAPVAEVEQVAPVAEQAPVETVAEAAPAIEVHPDAAEVLKALRGASAAVQAADPSKSAADVKATVMGVLMTASNGARKPGDVPVELRQMVIDSLAGLTSAKG